ncbi:MAG: glycosyltransferase [Thermoplasmata archaeon]|nr:glycosyltransferase [Thermoplasmata archaeon]
MKPIVVFVPLPPSYRGGTEEYAYRVAARVATVWPVRVVTTSVRWSPGSSVVPTGQAAVERVPAREIFQRPLVTTRSAKRRLRELARSASLVHVHMPFPLVERWVAQWAHEAGIPLVLTYHMDADFAGASGRRSGDIVTAAYRAWSARPALRRAAAIVSNSRGYAETSPVLREYLGKVHTIAKGIDPQRFGLSDRPSAPPAAPNVPLDREGSAGKRVLFVGRFVPYKGIPVLLEAVDHLRNQGTGVQLLLAGRGPEESRLRELVARLGLGDVVRFLGFVPDGELAALYRGADVVVCASAGRLESTPTTLEEAAALGVPIVGSSLPGADESLPNDGVHGRLVPPGDPDALARAIGELLLAQRPPARSSPRTWQDTGEAYIELFRGLLPPGRLAERMEPT